MYRTKSLRAYIFFSCITISYTMFSGTQPVIDVVIPVHEKDVPKLEMVIEGIKKNGQNIRRIITVSSTRYSENAEWFDEARYPFSKNDVLDWIYRDVLHTQKPVPVPRLGWIYQQFLKLYAPFVIPNISPNVLVLDADTIFFKPVKFIDENGNILYAVGNEYWKPYFEQLKKLFKNQPITKVYPMYSGICHHMLFQKNVLENIFSQIISMHNTEPWKAILHCIDKTYLDRSCFSEYELYFNFVFPRMNNVKIRHLTWKNMPFNLHLIEEARKQGFDYVSCQSWLS